MSAAEDPDATDTADAEFGTLAEWTADAALELGEDHFVAAGCRGSASPSVLHWLLERMGLDPASRFLDAGAGVGGPAAFAAQESGVRPVATEPQGGACRAARRLFDFPVIQAGTRLPFRTAAFDAVWSLGVLDTTDDQLHMLEELTRVLRPDGRLGLLVFLTTDPAESARLSSNTFPDEEQLSGLLRQAGLDPLDSAPASSLDQAPPEWSGLIDDVDQVLRRDHESDPAWSTAEEQSGIIGDLLASRAVVGQLITARRP